MANFSDIINSPKPVLVDFSAEWCGPCKMMAPILKEVAGKVGDRARIIKIDVDKNPAVAQKYQVMSVPTLVVFKNGEIKFRESGVMQAAQLVSLLERNM
jgi:thioredoxin 1